MKAVILAAGKGSRLAPFTDIMPKPLMPIGLSEKGCFITIIEKLIRQLNRAGINEIFIIVNYKAELIMKYLKEDGGVDGVKLSYLVQSELDGNAGAFYRAQHLLGDESVLVTDCDNFIDDDEVFVKMCGQFDSDGVDLTVGVCPVDDVTKYAIIKTDEVGKPVDIYEKPSSSEGWGNLAKSGVMILSSELASKDRNISITEKGEYTTTEIVRHCINGGGSISLHPFDRGFTDIGTWNEYAEVLKANL